MAVFGCGFTDAPDVGFELPGTARSIRTSRRLSPATKGGGGSISTLPGVRR